MLKSLCSIVGFLFVFLSATVLLAKPIPVRDVKVDVQGKTALEARDLAMSRARQVAFTKLAQEYPEYGISVHNGVPPDRILEGLVIDYEVVREKMSAVRYIGVFNFNFNDRALQKYLSGSPRFVKPGSDVVSDVADKEGAQSDGRFLIIPIYISPDTSYLWEETNPWSRYWINQETKTKGKINGRQFTVPLGDLRDISGLTIEDAMTSKMQPLSLTMERYQGDIALILILKSLDDGMNSHELLVKAHSRNGVFQQSYEPIVLQGQKGVTQNDIFKTAVQKSIAMITGKGNVDLSAAVEPSHSAEGDQELGSASPSSFKAVVSFNSFQDWQAIRQTLSNSEFIDDFDVLNLNRHQAEIYIRSRIPASALREKLGQMGVSLQQSGGKSRISSSHTPTIDHDRIPHRVVSPFEPQPLDEAVEVIDEVDDTAHAQPEVIE